LGSHPQACAGDVRLRAEVERLLRSRSELGSFHESPRPDPPATVDAPIIGERPGTAIGPYKLIQQIGEGGMGTVYMAEQTRPVKRLVALKLIKAGLDSRQVLARFEAERQALALMDHPNIAKVLDAGATDSGRPYFVMELVKGIPIIQFCDERRLTPRERLELFIPVCQAVQHAHQKGIIHRDLKPSNVLIAPYDGKPVVKVIDFGVAKATGQRLTEKTLVTDFGAVVGTLEYMSPEQAELNNQDIDTRSDIYSLGVLLYELLVLQRRFPDPTSHAPPPLGATSLAVACGRSTIALPTPMGHPQDLVHVPHAYLQQVDQKGAHFGNTHLRLFFPPLVLSGVPGTPGRVGRGSYGGANRPSLVSRTHPGHTVPWPT